MISTQHYVPLVYVLNIFLEAQWISYLNAPSLQEVSEMVNRPRLQTILSIMTAHPFSPRVEVPVSQRPPPPSFD